MKLQEESVTNTGVALTDAVRSIHSIQDNVYTQSSSIEETSRTIQIMIDTFVSITDTMKQAGEIASNLSVVAEEGGKMIRETMQSIQSVQLESKNITEIISIIKNIADQTNILSLNASIESAHAGDAG
jgi:methyl-accepting chemotaxis protein